MIGRRFLGEREAQKIAVKERGKSGVDVVCRQQAFSDPTDYASVVDMVRNKYLYILNIVTLIPPHPNRPIPSQAD